MKPRDLTLLAALLLIAGYFTFAVGNYGFVTPRNLSQLVVEVSITATLAIGMLLVILPGHIDLSAGSGVGLMGGLAAVLVTGSGRLSAGIADFLKWVDTNCNLGLSRYIPPPPWPDPVVIGICILFAMIVWALMGTLIVKQRIQAFIVTLGGMLIFKGYFWKVIESRTVPVTGASRGHAWDFAVSGHDVSVPQDWLPRLTTTYLSDTAGLWLAGGISALLLLGGLAAWARRKRLGIPGTDGEIVFVRWLIVSQLLFLFVLVANQYQGVPLPAVILGGIAWFVHTLTANTRFGRYLYAIGGNEEAAVVSGINVKRVTIWAFALMGAIVAVVGCMQTAYAGYSTTVVGDLMELDAVAACVIGGVSLKGGRGTVFGVFLGALIMATLAKGMSLMGVGPEDKFIVRGAVLVLAVWVDTRVNK